MHEYFWKLVRENFRKIIKYFVVVSLLWGSKIFFNWLSPGFGDTYSGWIKWITSEPRWTFIVLSIGVLGILGFFIAKLKKVFRVLLYPLGCFSWSLIVKYVTDDEFKLEINNTKETNNELTYSIHIGCHLGDYQRILGILLNNKKVTALKWTNIISPSKHFDKTEEGIIERPHQELFKKFTGEKYRFCIIGEENIGDWEKEYAALQQHRLTKNLSGNDICGDNCSFEFCMFENSSSGENAYLRYVAEKDLHDLSDKGPTIRLGDYAIIEEGTEKIMVAYNPYSEDMRKGDLWLTFGDLDSYPNIFESLDRHDGIAFFDRSKKVQVFNRYSNGIN